MSGFLSILFVSQNRFIPVLCLVLLAGPNSQSSVKGIRKERRRQSDYGLQISGLDATS
jgi:hypothetical protein